MIGKMLRQHYPLPGSLPFLAAHSSPHRANPDAVRAFTAALSQHVRSFDSYENREKANVDFIKKTFGYPEADIRDWMDTVKYTEDCSAIEGSVIQNTLK
jgi:hypothetical protein